MKIVRVYVVTVSSKPVKSAMTAIPSIPATVVHLNVGRIPFVAMVLSRVSLRYATIISRTLAVHVMPTARVQVRPQAVVMDYFVLNSRLAMTVFKMPAVPAMPTAVRQVRAVVVVTAQFAQNLSSAMMDSRMLVAHAMPIVAALVMAQCGDGVFCPEFEVCDDGFTDSCGSCNVTCTGPGDGATCGDGAVVPNLRLATMVIPTPVVCNSDCTGPGGPSVCGDGVICAELEACDDGFTDACGSCNSDCSGVGTGFTCGDSEVCPEREFCDDGFTDSCGSCNADCTGLGTGAVCGDGLTCPELEFCDDGFTDACGSCNADCTETGAGQPAVMAKSVQRGNRVTMGSPTHVVPATKLVTMWEPERRVVTVTSALSLRPVMTVLPTLVEAAMPIVLELAPVRSAATPLSVPN